MLGPPQAEDFEVTWDAAAACPDRGAVLDELRALAGAPASQNPTAAGVTVDGIARETEEGFEVALTLGDRRAEAREVRVFRDPDCATATRMAVLLASVAIRTLREQAAEEPSEPAAPDPKVSPPVSRPTAPPPDRRPRPTLQPPRGPWLDASVGVVIDPLSVGAVTGGPRLGLHLRWRRAGVRLRGLYLVPRQIIWAQSMGAVVSLGAAEAQGCWLRSRGRTRLDVCGGLELGTLRAAGFGVPDARVDHALWATATAGVGVSVALHPLVRLSFEPQLLVAVARPEVRFETPTTPIHRAPPLGARVGVTVLVWLRRNQR